MSASNFPNRPILSLALRPAREEDGARLNQALLEIASQKTSIEVSVGPVENEFIVSVMSVSDLESTRGQLQYDYKIDIECDPPKVIYLETIRKPAEAQGKYIRQTGGSGNYGHCKIRIEPNRSGAGNRFINQIQNGSIPAQYISAIEQGVREALHSGILRGYPIVDVRITLLDGSHHETDSNEMAFQFAGSIACKEAARLASPVLLEPMMNIEIPVSEELSGTVLKEISARRGRVETTEHVAGLEIITAILPIAEILDHKSGILSELPMDFAGYEPIAGNGPFGGDNAGVTANKPSQPGPGHGSASAHPDSESN